MLPMMIKLVAFVAAGLLGAGIAFLVAATGSGDALVGLSIISGLVAAVAFLQVWHSDGPP